MQWMAHKALLPALIVLAAAGCNKNPFLNSQQSAWRQQQPFNAQMQDLNSRVSQLDVNNRDMHTQLAQSQQQAKLMKEQLALVQKRLNDTATQLQDSQVAKQEAEQQIEALQASTRYRGGATITANNSIRRSLQAVEIPGLEVRQEDDVIRIELPSDRLFYRQSVQLQQNASQILDSVASAISRNYPRQIIGVEGHTDNQAVSAQVAASGHQLTAAQAMVIFDQLVTQNRIPASQLFTTAHGANHPRASNATPAGQAKNRRIELVIYPESIEDR